MAANGIHISLAAEPIFTIGNFVITNSMFTSVLVSGLLITFALIVNRSLKQTDKPTGLQNFAEWVVESLYNFVNSVTGDLQKTSQFFPIFATFFLFILLNNWLGLLPGVGTIVGQGVEAAEHATEEVAHTTKKSVTEEQTESPNAAAEPSDSHSETVIDKKEATHDTVLDEQGKEPVGEEVLTETKLAKSDELAASEGEQKHKLPTPFLRPGTADLNTTIALGLISIFAVQFFGFKALSFSYFGKFFNFSSPVMFYVGILELISEVSKIISFAFRLFGNIFAGEVLLVVITSLTGLVAPIPFYGLEVFVGFIQALVFSMLSLVLFNMATVGHDDHSEH